MTRKSAAFLFGTMLLMIVLGFIMQVSIGPYIANPIGNDDPYYEAKNQAMFGGLGLLALLFTSLFDYRRYAQWATVLYTIVLLMLIACFIKPIGLRINGSARWLNLGIQFQPSEVAKLVGVMVIAAWCARRPELRKTFLQGFLLPLSIVGGLVVAIACEVDLGNALLLSFAALAVLYAAGARLRFLAGSVLALGGGLTLAISFIPGLGERMGRITAFLDLEKYRATDGLQQWLGLLAFGTGGPTGLGMGNSRQKIGAALPYANSDMISSVIGEELGGWFCIFMIACYVTMTVAGFFIAIHAPDRFGKLLGFGIVCLIAMQTVIHLGVTTALLPNKGMPLPFVSAGGSNLLCLLASIGILLNLHRQSARLHRHDPILGRAKLTPAL